MSKVSLKRLIPFSLLTGVILLLLFISLSKDDEFVIRERKSASQLFEDSRVITEKEELNEIKVMLENLNISGIYDMAGTPDYKLFFRQDEKVIYSAWKHNSPKLTVVNSNSGGTTIDITDPLYQLITSEEVSELALTELALANYVSNKISAAFEQVKTSPTEKSYLELYYTLLNIQKKVEKEIAKYESTVDKDTWNSYIELPDNSAIERIKQLAGNTEEVSLEDRIFLERIEVVWVDFEENINQLLTEDLFNPSSLTKKYVTLTHHLADIN